MPELIVAGDIIISVNSKKRGSIEDWDRETSKLKPDQTASFKVKRKMKGIISEKIKLINMSKVVSSSKEGNKKTKQKINDYVREIDKCIALLNK